MMDPSTILNGNLGMQQEPPMSSQRVGHRLWGIIGISLLVHVGSLVAGKTFLAEWRWAHHPVHAFVECSGSLIAFLVAALLLLQDRHGKGTSFNPQIAAALIGMGVLDGLHAMVHAGECFVWLHSTATFVGGMFFILVWLPVAWTRRLDWLPLAAFVVVLAFGIGSLVLVDRLPRMVREGSFTFGAQTLNVCGGILLFFAAFRLIRSYLVTKNVDDLLFCLHSALFGAAAVMFEQSQLWDAPWWAWHLLRLMAYGVAFWFVVRSAHEIQTEIVAKAAELRQEKNTLEDRVFERTAELREANTALKDEIAERIEAKVKLQELSTKLIKSSRQAGMAEIATGVLHNVGNVLNSVNVSATIVADKLRKSKVSSLSRAAGLIRERGDDLGTFFTEDEKGRKLPGYLTKLAEHLVEEQSSMIGELESLTKNIEHIKKIVSTQQSHAGAFGVVETVRISDIIEDALTVNATSFEHYGIEMVREYADLPPIALDKQKLLQIMVNLVRNAKHAVIDSDCETKCMTLRVFRDGDARVHIEIEDTGMGISEENLTRIFAHGFTTKKDGHGFGLHSAALAAKEMGGSLSVHSDGPGKGATFTLDLPLELAEVTA